MNTKGMKHFFITILLLCGLSFCISAQTNVGAISGEVFDSNGAAVSGVTITLARVNGLGQNRVAVSSSDGRFTFDRVSFGDYSIRADKEGFMTAKVNVKIESANVDPVKIQLEVGGVEASVVVSSASRIEEELRDSPASVSVVSRGEIENREARTTGYELVGQPSIFVPKYDDGAYTTVIIRGVPERHHNDTFLALVDGVPFVSPGDEIDLEIIPIDIVERVEIVRGPTSALYGRGGIAGVVNYQTRTIAENFKGTLGFQYGRFNFMRPHFDVSFPVAENRSFLYFNGNFDHRDGWRDGTQRNSGNFLVKNQWNISNRFSLTSLAGYYRHKQGVSSHLPVRDDGSIVNVTGGRTANYNIENSHYAKDGVILGTTLNTAFTPDVNLKTIFHYRQFNTKFNGGFNNGFNETTSTIDWNGFYGEGKPKTFYVEPQLTWITKRFRFVGGASYEKINSRSTEDWTGEFGFNPTTFEFLFYIQRRNYRTGRFTNRANWITDRLLDAKSNAFVGSGYGQAQLDLTSKLFVTVGGRYDYFKRRVNYAATSGGGPAQTVSDSDGHFSPKVSLSYRWSPSVTTYASFGEGYSPGFGPVWSFGGRNTDLKPEIARNYEIGLRGDFLDRRLFISATGYLLQRKDLILLVNSGTTTRTVNIGKQQSAGFEFESRFDLERINRGLFGYFNYSYTDSVWKNYRFVDEFTGEVFDYTGKTPRSIPSNLFSVGLNKTFRGSVNLRGWLDFIGEYFVDPGNRVKAGRHALVNAAINIPLKDGKVDFRLAATNLLNKKFFYWAGYSVGPAEAYPGMPIQLIGSFRIRL